MRLHDRIGSLCLLWGAKDLAASVPGDFISNLSVCGGPCKVADNADVGFRQIAPSEKGGVTGEIQNNVGHNLII